MISATGILFGPLAAQTTTCHACVRHYGGPTEWCVLQQLSRFIFAFDHPFHSDMFAGVGDCARVSGTGGVPLRVARVYRRVSAGGQLQRAGCGAGLCSFILRANRRHHSRIGSCLTVAVYFVEFGV